MSLPSIPDGEFYACNDPETLTFTDPWEAVESYLDDQLGPEMTVAQVEAEIGKELRLTAYVPTPVTDLEIKRWADRLVDVLQEDFNEEHGDPDDGTDLCPEAGAIMLEAVTKIAKATRSWSCHASGHVDLTGDQVLEWAREERPDWFEEEPPKPAPPVAREPIVSCACGRCGQTRPWPPAPSLDDQTLDGVVHHPTGCAPAGAPAP